ncbi:MAG: response regulator, partial [Cyanobacteria bacterium J083]
MTKSAIKLLLVEDSKLALTILQRLLSNSPDISVVGTATNGKKALELIPQLQPDVICTDLKMEGMNGLELTQAIMQKFPRPILVISNAVNKNDTDNVFNL